MRMAKSSRISLKLSVKNMKICGIEKSFGQAAAASTVWLPDVAIEMLGMSYVARAKARVVDQIFIAEGEASI